jgi:hypothetical protein
MAKLTSAQANALANDFLGLAQAIGNFRYDNWNEMSKTQNQQLGKMQWSILNYGEDILALSTTLAMDDVQASLNKINDTTLEIMSTIQQLKNIQKVINVAGAIIAFGGAVISKDPSAIKTGLQGVIDSWKDKS